MTEPSPAETHPLALGPFLRRVQSLAETLSPRELAARLLRVGGLLPANERAAFLRILDGSPSLPDDALLPDIDAFLGRLEAGRYFREWSFAEGRALGDESWAAEMDALFARAARAYVEGTFSLAGTAYERLLRAFLLEGEGEIFCGPRPAQEMISTDLDEAKARYLRVRYGLIPLEQRAPRLLQELESLAHVGGWRLGLRQLDEAGLDPLPELSAFLPLWLEQLRAAPREGRASAYPIEDMRRALLREAVALWGGAAGLKALAREEGAWHPEAYGAWIDHLRSTGDRAAAISAAREGLLRVEEPAERAALAERLAVFAREEESPELLREALRGAFRAAPSVGRLARLFFAIPAEERAAAASAELDEARRHSEGFPESLLAWLEMLRGEARNALRLLSNASPLGWSRSEHPGPVVAPALLWAASRAPSLPEGSALARLWRDADREPETPPQAEPDAPRALLREALLRVPLSATQAQEALDLCARAAERRARAIISNKHRRAYARAARLLVACTEAHYLAGSPQDGDHFLKTVRDELRRHHSFREELDRAVNASPWLGTLAP